MICICLDYSFEITEALIVNKNADLDLQDRDGKTALEHAFGMKEDVKWKIIEALIKNDANPNTQFNDGQPLLNHFIDLIVIHSRKLAEFLYGKRKDAGCPINLGDLAKLLLEKGANPNLTNKEGNTGLLLAAKQGLFRKILLLLQKGANPNLKNKSGKTALSYVIGSTFPNPEAVKNLLLYGAQCEKEDLQTLCRVVSSDAKTLSLAHAAYEMQEYMKTGSFNGLDSLLYNVLQKPELFTSQDSKNLIAIDNFDLLCMVLRSLEPCKKHVNHCPGKCHYTFCGPRFVSKMANKYGITFSQVVDVLQSCNYIPPMVLELALMAIDKSKGLAQASERREDFKNRLLQTKRENNKDIVNQVIESYSMTTCKQKDFFDLNLEYL